MPTQPPRASPMPKPMAQASLAGRLRLGRLGSRAESLGWRATAEPYTSLVYLVPALIALGVAAAEIGIRLWYEAQGPYNVDTPLYWTVGRGILHGYVPYRDLYETKPPGIFLLSALSYLVTGDGALTHASQFLAVAFVALSPLVYVRRLVRAPAASSIRPLLGITVEKLPATVTLLALWAMVLVVTGYAASRADEVQVEAHGLAGMVGYMLLLGVPGRWAFRGRVLAIVLAIGMKEPFLLLLPAVYLVMDPRARRSIADLWGPLLVAGMLGALFLLLVGWLPAFIGIYLPSMVGAHVQVYGSPWDRVWAGIDLTWQDLRKYSVLLPVALLYCTGVYLVGPTGRHEPAQPFVARRFQALFAGLALAAFAVGLGGQFYAHHHVFAVPVLLALLFALMSRLVQGTEYGTWPGTWIRPVLIALALAAAALAWVEPRGFTRRLETILHDDASARESALVIDAVLDTLKVDRYLYLGPGGFVPYPYTRHTPWGPLFFQQIVFFEGRYPWLVDEFRKRLEETRVVVVAEHMTGPLDDDVRAKLARDFQPASQHLIPDGKHCQYPILIRNDVKIP